jgi:hypothetical protein
VLPFRSGSSLVVLALVGTEGSAQSAPPSRVDWPKIADLVVTRSLKLAPGERVVLFWDQASDRGVAAAIRTAVARAGGVISGELSAPTQADLDAIRRLPPETQTMQKARRDSLWTRTFATSDVAIWLPTPMAGLTDRPFERLVERAPRVRSIHFHWFLPPDTADVGKIDALYAAAISVPPENLAARIRAVESAVRGATIRVTAPNGTDLGFKIPSQAWVHRNTGDASKAKVAGARSIRDREEELPASVFRTTDLAGAEGTIVGRVSFDTRSGLLAVTFKNGRVTKVESRQGADGAVTAWQKATGDKDLPAEFVIGVNPELPGLLPSGFMPYYGYGAGVVRLAFGDNWESGGKNRSSNGEMLLFLPDATVTANGQPVVTAGKLVVGSK